MRIKESERIYPQMFVYSTWTELIWSEQVDPVTRRVHWSRASAPRIYFVFIACSETRTVSARLVLNVTYAAWPTAVIADFGSLVVRLDVSDYCCNCDVLRWVKIKKNRKYSCTTLYTKITSLSLYVCEYCSQKSTNLLQYLVHTYGGHFSSFCNFAFLKFQLSCGLTIDYLRSLDFWRNYS